MKKTFFIIVLILAAGLAFCLYQIKHFAASPLVIKQETIFTLPAGTGREGLKAALRQQHIIKRTRWLPALWQLEPELASFKAGTYRLMPGMTVRQMLALLASGREAQFSIRFVEGSTFKEWLAILGKAPYLKHTLDGVAPEDIAQRLGRDPLSPLEGRFYPDTYLYTAQTTDVALLKRAGLRMDKTLDETWQGKAPGLPYKTPVDLLTMASIVEKETGLPDERPKVASVFINRLRLSMRLQTDPTVIYGMGESYKGAITKQDLATPTPYNTYLITGLPPAPIAMPGQASLAAAAHPARTSYLYFVADGKGGHTFSTNLASHNQAVQQYRESVKENHAQ
ncbi:endolytic transglycosylase MltG [Acerihabitans arboris]|uniref:Endolytic murein transglycosylase n=1 Tax=Acerihabitans arboris TaxID=2691583 RepID=A0A845SG39_9GAMM|nr:endolytic transglycosylase MltG [Acerihabitans arboris]NDL61914.1 endolytic transglycosylase MltG [Acerihabitans arboris]